MKFEASNFIVPNTFLQSIKNGIGCPLANLVMIAMCFFASSMVNCLSIFELRNCEQRNPSELIQCFPVSIWIILFGFEGMPPGGQHTCQKVNQHYRTNHIALIIRNIIGMQVRGEAGTSPRYSVGERHYQVNATVFRALGNTLNSKLFHFVAKCAGLQVQHFRSPVLSTNFPIANSQDL